MEPRLYVSRLTYYKSLHKHGVDTFRCTWLGSLVVRALLSQLDGREIDSRRFHF